MARRIEEEFQPQQLPYVPIVWQLLTNNGKYDAMEIVRELKSPTHKLVDANAHSIAQYGYARAGDTLVLRYIKNILPLLQQLDARDRASFAQGFMEDVAKWYTEDQRY